MPSAHFQMYNVLNTYPGRSWRTRVKKGTKRFIPFASSSDNQQARISTQPRLLLRAAAMSSQPYQVISTDQAPGAIGPYSQAVVHNGTIYTSGAIPLDPKTMQLVEGGIEAQAKQAVENLLAVVQASGGDKSTVLKTTVFLKDMNNFAKINGEYEKAFAPFKPARSAVEVARLPKDVGVEIEAVALVKK
ncbi:unnamed protein product [Jaminaea pallidilutea]